MESGSITNLMVTTVAAGLTAVLLGRWLNLPAIVLLLLFGVALGPSGLDWVRPALLGDGLETLVSLSVVIILFEGGLSLDLSALSGLSGSLRNMVSLGPLITLGGAAAASHWLAELPWSLALIFGALVTVTGPTVITPLLRQLGIEPEAAAILEGEGVLVDPLGAILAVVVFNLTTSPVPAWESLVGLGLRLGVGGLVGWLGGWLLARLLSSPRVGEDLYNPLGLAAVWGIFGLSDRLISDSGLLAVVIAGLVVRQQASAAEQELAPFNRNLTLVAIAVLFILLAADVSPQGLVALGWGGPLTVLALMLVVRPLMVGLCTLGSPLSWQQRLFISWLGPRGIVSASEASLFALLLSERGITGGAAIKSLVFLTVFLTVTLQGLSAGALAGWLGLRRSLTEEAPETPAAPVGTVVDR